MRALDPHRPANPRRKAWIAVVGLVLLALVGVGGYHFATSAKPQPMVTVSLPIMETSTAATAAVLPSSIVDLAPGQKFQIEVGQSDGPIAWQLVGAGDGHVLRQTALGQVGSCAPGLSGCRVPALYTFTAQSAGSTSLVWKEQLLSCNSIPGTDLPAPCFAYQKTILVTVS